MLLVNILLAFSSSTAFILGLFIIVGNTKRAVNRALAAFLFSIFIWLLANLLANLSGDAGVSLLFARSTMIGATIIPFTFLLFSKIYTHEANLTFRYGLKLAVPLLLFMLSVPTELNIVSIDAYGKNTVTGDIYLLLTPYLLGYFIWGFILLVRYYRRTKITAERARLKYIFIGIAMTLIPTVIANAILPSLGNTQAILYAPNSVIILAIFMTIAIVKHRLLNIRLLVARSIAYLLLLTSLVALYGIVVFGLADTVFNNSELPQRIVPIITALLLAFTTPYLRKIFDRFTNKFFYRDAYEPQIFLGELNTVLVGNVELELLLAQSSDVIKHNLKSESCAFIINKTDSLNLRIIGDREGKLYDDIEELKNQVSKDNSQRIIIMDELEGDNHELANKLRKHDIAVIAKFSTTVKPSADGIGSLLLGPKQSGNPYSTQDIKVIEIITNELAIAIQNALRFEEIEQFTVTLKEKVDDATRRLRQTNEKLKALDETKDEFISMASHQLRTPLTSVKGYISMVLEGDAGKITKQQKQLLDQAFLSSQRMVYLIADLLNVSRLKTGKFVIEPKRINLADIIESEIAQLKDTAASRSLKLRYDKPADFPELMLDDTKIRQVIMNFIDNAIYYTPSGGNIKVSLKQTPEVVEFTVVDDGIGVPKREQHQLFSKFYRAGNARKARPDGTGLGLFMAKKVIIAQGGHTVFKSTEGKGSTFGFAFPKSKVAIINRAEALP